MREALAESEALGERRIRWKILAALSQIETQLGNTAEAEMLRLQAQEIVKNIVAHIGTDERRKSFLALPEVLEIRN